MGYGDEKISYHSARSVRDRALFDKFAKKEKCKKIVSDIGGVQVRMKVNFFADFGLQNLSPNDSQQIPIRTTRIGA